MTSTPNEGNAPEYDPEGLRNEQFKIAGDLLGVSEDSARQRGTVVEGTSAVYVSGNEGAVIVAADRTHLFALNDVAKNDHIKAFWDGQRGNYQAPEAEEEKNSTPLYLLILLLVVGAVVVFFAFFLSGDDDDSTSVPPVDDTETTEPAEEPTATDEATEEETEEPADDETVTETAEPTEDETVTETAEPAPGEDETAPADEESPAPEETEDFNPDNAEVTLPNEFVEDEPTEVSGTGFMPGEEVEVSLTEVELGTVEADNNGEFNAEVVVEGPFASQDTEMFINGLESGASIEEQVSLVSTTE